MTLIEAIKHAKEKAEELGNCECAKEHLQLAKWLEELLAFREAINEIDLSATGIQREILKMLISLVED